MKKMGGSLDLSGCTGLTALPDGLTVGGSLDLIGCTGLDNKERNKVKRLRNGDYAPGKYLYADGILTHVRGCKTVSGYQMYIGKIPGKHVVSDGEMYAHCSTLKEGMEDIAYKRADKQGAEQYKNLTLDSVLAESDAVTMYRVITGACRQGSAAFVESLGEKRKEVYSVREMIELTRGQFGAASFEAFWKEY